MNHHSPLPLGRSSTPPSSAIEPSATDAVVRLVDVRRCFGETPALDGVSLSVHKGEVLGLIGRSGAGKSTLIRCLNGLERPDSGEVFIEGREISRLGERELQPLRRRIGMIFQHFNLLSAKTVEANIALPLKIAGVPKAERLRRAGELLELVGLTQKRKQFPNQLSGGQKQRVGIARALAAKPALLLSDEATSALDPETTQSILALLKDINRQLGLTVLLITHEMEVVRSVADRVAVIEDGRIVEEGAVWQVFARPQSPVTRRLLSTIRPQLPEKLAKTLSANGSGDALLRVDVAGKAARGSLLSDLARETGGGVRLVHGGIDTIQNEPVGTLFLQLENSDAGALHRATRFLQHHGAQMEVLGHVVDHA